MMEKILSVVEEAKLLGYFKTFCDKNSSPQLKQRIRNILSRAQDKDICVKNIFINEMGITLSKVETHRMLLLLQAYISKSNFRKSISDDTKRELLVKQCSKCAICGKLIDIHDHTDHIVPFKYVGDELEHNLQMLCSHCNKAKNASIDYQIRFLLKLV